MLTKTAVVFLAFSLSIGPWIEKMKRETNSRAATRRGIAEYGRKEFGRSAEELRNAEALRPSLEGAFNVGTAQIAGGKRDEGSKKLTEAIENPALRADAYYNRGNGALAAKAWDDAVRDYTEALRIRPGDRNAKRNLELALRQIEQEEQQQQLKGGGGQQKKSEQGGGGKAKQEAKADGGKKPDPKAQAGDRRKQDRLGEEEMQSRVLQALLRAIQQQEGEELQRMKRARSEGQKVGW